MNPRTILLTIALSCLGAACTPAVHTGGTVAANDTIDAQAAARGFNAIMQRHDIPGAQLVHAHDGQERMLVHGVMSRATGEPVTERTTFEAASLSKVVGAYIALRFVDEGMIDLDVPLRSYWSSPRIADGDPATAITARMVLNHTSGLPGWQISPSNPEIDATPLVSEFAPGERFSYSGESFYLLQKTLEHLSGLLWNSLAQREVFDRFDMPGSTFLTTPIVEGVNATGHGTDGAPRAERIFGWENTAWTLVTNARDYSRFIQGALYAGEGLAPATHALLFTESSNADTASAPNPAAPFISWGLGVGLQATAGRTLAWHWGDNPGFKAFFMLDPASGESIVLLTNSQNGLSTYREVLELFMGEGEYPAIDWVRAQG